MPLPSLLATTPSWPPPSALAHSSHQLFWVEVKAHFLNLIGPHALPSLYSILAKVESNAFGLYAAPPDKPTEDTPQPAPVDPLPTSDPQSSDVSTGAIDGVLPVSKVDKDNLGLKSIGRSLYPSASYFNHSCQPNCEVFETGSVLQVCAKTDIAEGDEVTIAYIDINQRLHDRRKQLFDTYFFHCQCLRCQREEAAGDGVEGERIPPLSYTTEAKRKKHRKRNARPKKKKIEPKYHDDTADAMSKLSL